MIIFKVVLKLPGGSVWAVVFFFMLVTIGIDSEFCIVESLVTGIVDMWPEQLRPKVRIAKLVESVNTCELVKNFMQICKFYGNLRDL